ncbi:hypothetical protein [uncultured Winogradskyella sp.]|uniref:hypothetical protein n=1 Tax=uncultured Winogradskyella sp. TaxID=395353 RepID=UPI00260ABB27|nr:hypothetical protein [uncultured Winogradskyella sp.]
MNFIFKTIAITFITLNFSYTQNNNINYLLTENRKGQLFFKVSSEYRITPLPYDAPNTFPVSLDLQSSGVAFAYTLDYFVLKNLSLGFSNSLRYSYIGADFTQIEGVSGSAPSNRGLIFGFHLYADYHFKIFKKSELFLRLGKSLLNRGTEINTKEPFFDNEGNLIVVIGSAFDAAYEPWNFGIGWKKRKLELMLGFYTSSNSEFFDVPEEFIVPYFKFSYNLGRL